MTLFKKLASALIVITFTLPASAAEKLNVIASFSILGDFAQKVGGDRIELRTIVGPDSDAHVYEPKPADAIAVAKADVVLVNGLLFEGFLQRLIPPAGTITTTVARPCSTKPRSIRTHGSRSPMREPM
jgi:zinc/manganese transport system substrate-binding protein